MKLQLLRASSYLTEIGNPSVYGSIHNGQQKPVESFDVEGCEVLIEVDRTASMYAIPSGARAWAFGCQCDFCSNASMGYRRFAPADQLDFLRRFPIDPWEPTLASPLPRMPGQPKTYVRRIACWFLYGSVPLGTRTPTIRFGGQTSAWVSVSRIDIRAWTSSVEQYQNDPSIIHLFAVHPVPWLYGELCTCLRERVPYHCPACNNVVRDTAYLKPRSRIPEWYGLPELRPVLQKRERRVFVELCVQCGDLQYRIVDRRPPHRIVTPFQAQQRQAFKRTVRQNEFLLSKP